MAEFICTDDNAIEQYIQKIKKMQQNYYTTGLLHSKANDISKKYRLLADVTSLRNMRFVTLSEAIKTNNNNLYNDFDKFVTEINKKWEKYKQGAKASGDDFKKIQEAYKKWQNIYVNGPDDASRKQKAWDEYLKAKAQKEAKNKPDWVKFSADAIAKGIWIGTITKNGKLLFGSERAKYLEEMVGKDKAKKVQEELDKLAGGGGRKTQDSPKPTPTKRMPTETISKRPEPTVTTPKPTPTKRMPTETISKRPEPTATKTPKPAVTTQKPAATTQKPAVTTAKPTATTPKPTVTTKKPTVITQPKPTTAPDPGGIKASDGVKSRLEDEIKRLREQLEKEQQERINLEQRVQQQQQQQQPVVQPQPRATTPSVNPTPAQIVQPEQPTVAPTSTPAPAVVIPSGGDSGSTGSGNTGSGGTGTAYDSPSLPNPNAGDSGSGSSSSSSSGGFNPIPIGIGLGAAVAGGIGVKAYVNHRNNAKFDDENEDSVTNGNRFWTDEDPNVVHTEEDMFNNDSNSKDVSYQAVENNTNGDDTWNIEEQELPDDNSFDLLSESN